MEAAMPPENKGYGNLYAQVAYYASLGFVLPAAAGAGYGIGWLLDGYFHTAPVVALVMTGLGAVGGFVELFALLKRAEQRQSRDV